MVNNWALWCSFYIPIHLIQEREIESMPMKLSFVIFFLIPLVAWSFDPYEDTQENLAPQTELNRSVPESKSRLGNGTWVFAFELMNADGTSTILAQSNRSTLVKPASTMKLFTSWFAHKQGFRDSTYLSKMLKESVNEMADSTLRLMGGPKALRAFYAGVGLDLNATNFIQVDGSGLSYDNKTNCDSQISLLKLIFADAEFETFKDFLAQPGEEGTLRERLLDVQGRLFAKTGTLKRTASLSGFVETKAGTVVFCILTDYLPAPSRSYRPRIDAMVLKNIESLDL